MHAGILHFVLRMYAYVTVVVERKKGYVRLNCRCKLFL